MKPRILIGILFLWAVSVGVAHASVRINEIAWMGTAVSGTNEWIELANDTSEPVDLSGWMIIADDGSPSISLSGRIEGNGYFLIERTDDTTVPSVTADLIAAFGNGLSNSGETLRLKDSNGLVIDTVIGGENWTLIGGNNTTKETAQRTATGWITATATPRAINANDSSTGSLIASDKEGQISQNTTSSSGSAASTPLAPSPYPRSNISIGAGENMRTFVGFPVKFSGDAKGLYDEPLPYATYRWNFGDGATGVGKNTEHAYLFPGEYTIVFDVVFGNLHNSDRIIVVVTNPDIVIVEAKSGDDGYITLHNRTGKEIDLSDWTLRTSSGKTFVLSPHTILLSGKSVTFPNATTHLSPFTEVSIFSPQGASVASFPPVASFESNIIQAEIKKTKRSEPVTAKMVSLVQKNPVMSLPAQEPLMQDEDKQEGYGTETAATILWNRKVSDRGESVFGYQLSNTMLFLILLGGVLLLALAGFIILRSDIDHVSPAEEYAIIEDIIENENDSAR